MDILINVFIVLIILCFFGFIYFLFKIMIDWDSKTKRNKGCLYLIGMSFLSFIVAIILLTIFPTKNFQDDYTDVFMIDDYVKREIPWDSLIGVYKMDRKSKGKLGIPQKEEFYIILYKDTTYTVNQYLDSEIPKKIIKDSFTKKVLVLRTHEKMREHLPEMTYQFNFQNLESYDPKDKRNSFGISLMEFNESKKPFLMMSYPLSSTVYTLKYDKISDDPITLEELEKINKEDK